MLFFYRFLTYLIYPFLIFLIYLRTFLKKEEKLRFKEKLFPSHFSAEESGKKKLIWIHAASLGETLSVFSLIDELNKKQKNLEFLITTVTLSSGKLVKKKIYEYSNIKHRYFPLDINFLVKEFLAKWSPNLILFVDSEIWPNFLTQIKMNKIPLILVNGRITKKTFTKWMLVPSFAKKIFKTFDLCLASSKDSETYLKKLNVNNLKFLGNLKFADKIEIKNIKSNNESFLKKRLFWCAASTHPNEEIFCFKTHINLKKKFKDIVTIIIPRHINRTSQIKNECVKLDLSYQILSDKNLISDNKEIIIVNSFGVLKEYFKYARSVFIGKSIIKKLSFVSGQNPLEAAKLGCKIYHGPYVYNFKEIYDLLKKYKIAEQIFNEEELADKLSQDFKEPKDKENKISEKINFLGKKILEESTAEIEKYL